MGRLATLTAPFIISMAISQGECMNKRALGQYRRIEKVLRDLKVEGCLCECSKTLNKSGNWYYPFEKKMKEKGITPELLWEIFYYMHPCSNGWELQVRTSQGELREEDVFHISARDFLASAKKVIPSFPLYRHMLSK